MMKTFHSVIHFYLWKKEQVEHAKETLTCFVCCFKDRKLHGFVLQDNCRNREHGAPKEFGGVAERLIAPVLKTGMGESPSRVRIPPPPPFYYTKTCHSVP